MALGAGWAWLLVLAGASAPPAEPASWMRDAGGTLRLDVVVRGEPSCGGVVVVDRERRRLRFDTPTESVACGPLRELSFDEVGSVRARGCVGFEIEWGAANVVAFVPPSDARAAGVPCDRLPSGLREDAAEAVDRLREAVGRVAGPDAVLNEALEGRPVDASVAEIAADPGSYLTRSLRVRGRLERAAEGFRLSDGASIALAPTVDAALLLASAAHWNGAAIDVVGHLLPDRTADEAGRYVLKVLDGTGPEDVALSTVPIVSLPALAADPAAYQGKQVRVRASFRGNNLYIDLPPKTRRGAEDWVIKADRSAAWITGHKPGSEGFALDAEDPQASRHWVEVVASPSIRDGVLYLAATHVGIVKPPPGGHVAARRQIFGPAQAPTVIFSHPLSGERLSPDGVVVVQFSKQMDETSFAGRVRLTVAGVPGEAVVEVEPRLRYVSERNALIVKPLARLAPGARVQIGFAAGIVDGDGNPLRPPGSGSDALTYFVQAD